MQIDDLTFVYINGQVAYRGKDLSHVHLAEMLGFTATTRNVELQRGEDLPGLLSELPEDG
jgi:hypothetical protein